jgi:hypothetical protein
VLLQALSLQLFHDDEGMAVVIFDFVDGADGGVVKQGRGAGLALEAFHCLAVAGEIVGKKLYGDVAAEASVFRFVDHTHTAAAKLSQNSIVGDRLADHRRAARTLARRFAVHGEASASVGGNVRPWVESGQLLPAIADMAIPKGAHFPEP